MGHGRGLCGLVASPDGKRIAGRVVEGDRRSVRVRNLADGKSVEVAALPAVMGDRLDPFGGPLGFSADGQRLLLPRPGGGWAGYDLATGTLSASDRSPLLPWQAGRDLYASDGQTAFTRSRFGSASIPHNVATGKPTAPAPDPTGCVTTLHFAPDGRLYTLAAGRVFVYDPATGENLHQSRPLPESGSARFSADGSGIAVVGVYSEGSFGDNTTIRVCDTRTGKGLAAVGPVPGYLTGFNLSADAGRVTTVSAGPSGRGGTTREWDARTGKLLAEKTAGADDIPLASNRRALSPDGKWLASASPEAPIYLWRLKQ